MDWYDFKLQNIWTAVTTVKEAKQRGAEEPMQLANAMPSMIPMDLLTIP